MGNSSRRSIFTSSPEILLVENLSILRHRPTPQMLLPALLFMLLFGAMARSTYAIDTTASVVTTYPNPNYTLQTVQMSVADPVRGTRSYSVQYGSNTANSSNRDAWTIRGPQFNQNGVVVWSAKYVAQPYSFQYPIAVYELVVSVVYDPYRGQWVRDEVRYDSPSDTRSSQYPLDRWLISNQSIQNSTDYFTATHWTGSNQNPIQTPSNITRGYNLAAGQWSNGPTTPNPLPPPAIPNPTPSLVTLSSNTARAGQSGFTLTVTGNNLITNSVIRWNGTARPTTYLSATQLQTNLTDADFAQAGTYTITVVNPSPGGGVSNGLAFTVRPRTAQSRLVVSTDYDGDGKSDLAVFRPSDKTWYLQKSRDGFSTLQWGYTDDVRVPGDYNGDGITDVAVWRPSNGFWYFMRPDGTLLKSFQFGLQGDIPVPGDYDGDGKTDVAVWRPSDGTWYIRRQDGSFYGGQFGLQGDIPVPGDYDGDGKTDLAVWRPSDGTWYTLQSTNGVKNISFGKWGDVPVPGDYDGDGMTDVAVVQSDDPNNIGTWVWRIARFDGTPVNIIQFGYSTDKLVPGDYDGDGKTDVAVWRPSDGTWYIRRQDGSFYGAPFGLDGDLTIPVVPSN